MNFKILLNSLIFPVLIIILPNIFYSTVGTIACLVSFFTILGLWVVMVLSLQKDLEHFLDDI